MQNKNSGIFYKKDCNDNKAKRKKGKINKNQC